MNTISPKVLLDPSENKSPNKLKGEFQSLRQNRPQFKEILRNAPVRAKEKPQTIQDSLIDKIQRFIKTWDRIDNSIKERLRTLPKESRSLIELQYLANNIHLQSEMISKTGEAAGNTIKRIHQMGSN